MNVKSAVVAVALLGGFGTMAQGATVTVACGAQGQEFEICKADVDAWAKKTGHNVRLYTPPASTTDMLAQFRQMFAAKSSDLDVLLVDVIWPGIIKDHLTDLGKYSKGVEKEHFPAIIANNTVDGKLLAMPLYTDAGLLYYRKDLLDKYKLKLPATWDELAVAARKIQDGERASGSKDFQGLVFQAKAYEGLTCDAVEWLASFGGGSIVDAGGKVTVNNPKAVLALKTAAGWIGSIAPSGVLNYGEDEARGVFQSGKAAFMRNWPYAWSLAQGADSPVRNKIGVAPLPQGGADGRHAGALGGWQLAVSRYSKNPEAAADLVLYLTSKEVQKKRAIIGSFKPTIMSLYQDKEVMAANPFFASLFDVFANAVPRPSSVTGSKYPAVSEAFWNATHDVLAGKASAEDALKRLEGRLNQIKRGVW